MRLAQKLKARRALRLMLETKLAKYDQNAEDSTQAEHDEIVKIERVLKHRRMFRSLAIAIETDELVTAEMTDKPLFDLIDGLLERLPEILKAITNVIALFAKFA
jgi:hypothetical protein